MTIQGIGTTTPFTPTQGAGATGWQQRMQQTLGPVASLFNETTDQLLQELRSGGQSLSSLAQSKGVSQTDLLNAIKQGLQSAGNSQVSDSQLSNLAGRIANHKHGHHHHGANGLSGVGGVGNGTATVGGTDSDGDHDGSGAGPSATGSSNTSTLA
jgi:hypothetical protein